MAALSHVTLLPATKYTLSSQPRSLLPFLVKPVARQTRKDGWAAEVHCGHVFPLGHLTKER